MELGERCMLIIYSIRTKLWFTQILMVHGIFFKKGPLVEIPTWKIKISVVLYCLSLSVHIWLQAECYNYFLIYSLPADSVLSIAVNMGLGFVNCTINLAGYVMEKEQLFGVSVQLHTLRFSLQLWKCCLSAV